MSFTAKLAAPTIGLGICAAVWNFAEDALPVVVMMRADQVETTGDSYSAHMVGRKILPCLVIEGSEIGWYRIGGVFSEGADFEFIDDQTPGSSKPVSIWTPNDFGVWKWSNLPLGADQVMLTLQHNCSGKIRLTQIGPFNIEASAGT